MGPWLEGSCNATCGTNSVKTLTRKIVQNAMNGGKQCDPFSVTKKTVNCGYSRCPSEFLIF